MAARVLVSDPIDAEGVAILSEFAVVDVRTDLTSEDELCGIIGQYDALMVRSGTKVTAKVISCGTKLRVIGRAGVGVDNVDVAAASSRGIYVVNSPTGNVVAAAELTFGLMFALVRHVAPADASVRAGRWERARFIGSQLSQKTLGIVGYGRVGRHVARLATAAGMEVHVYDPYVTDANDKLGKCYFVDLEHLLKSSDFVTLHVPMTQETRLLINAESLSMMKPTARIINTCRGGVMDEDALAKALKAHTIAGAALDVYQVEKPFPADHPLLSAPNLLLTPHIGASTEEAQKFVAVDTAQQIVATLKGKIPSSPVNLPMVRPSPEEFAAMAPLMQCAESLGRLAAQLLEFAPLERIGVTIYPGDFGSHMNGEPILLAVASGALGVYTGEPVNYINVKNFATSQKTSLAMSKASQPPVSHPLAPSECRSSTSSVEVTLTARDSSVSASLTGSVLDHGEPLLKSIQGRAVLTLLPPAGHSLLYCEFRDEPSVLKHITDVLVQDKVNIDQCHIARHNLATVENHSSCNSNEPAIALIRTQKGVSEVALTELKSLNLLSRCLTLRC